MMYTMKVASLICLGFGAQKCIAGKDRILEAEVFMISKVPGYTKGGDLPDHVLGGVTREIQVKGNMLQFELYDRICEQACDIYKVARPEEHLQMDLGEVDIGRTKTMNQKLPEALKIENMTDTLGNPLLLEENHFYSFKVYGGASRINKDGFESIVLADLYFIEQGDWTEFKAFFDKHSTRAKGDFSHSACTDKEKTAAGGAAAALVEKYDMSFLFVKENIDTTPGSFEVCTNRKWRKKYELRTWRFEVANNFGWKSYKLVATNGDEEYNLTRVRSALTQKGKQVKFMYDNCKVDFKFETVADARRFIDQLTTFKTITDKAAAAIPMDLRRTVSAIIDLN